MSTFFRLYFATGALLLAGALVFGLGLRLCPRSLALAPRRWLRIAALWVGAAFIVPIAARLTVLLPIPAPLVLSWAKDLAVGADAPVSPITWHSPAGVFQRAALEAPSWYLTAGLLLAGLIALLGVRLYARTRQLARDCAALPVVRRQGQLILAATDAMPSPFSARTGGTAYIVIPTAMWTDPERVRMIVAHEGAHLRHGDLQVALLLELLKLSFCWNPGAYLWDRVLRQLQEIACDGTARRRFGPVRYGGCLVWVAELGRAKVYRLTGALHMARSSVDDLKRRIRMLFAPRTSPKAGLAWATATATVGIVAMGLVSLAATAALAEPSVDGPAAQRMADQIRERSGFVVPVDDWVVAQLNQLVGPRRDWSRRALARMQPLRAGIERQLAAASLPPDLRAIAFAESGFDDTVKTSMGSAGIWQFIPGTARSYGLEVSDLRDDRMDLAKSTTAVVAMLRELHREFQDWPLAIAAYNSGSGRVLKVVKQMGSRDVALLARTGKLGQDAKNGYTQTVLASVLLLNNPQLLD